MLKQKFIIESLLNLAFHIKGLHAYILLVKFSFLKLLSQIFFWLYKLFGHKSFPMSMILYENMLTNKSPSSVHSLIREIDRLKKIKVHHQRMKNLSKTQSNQIRIIERCSKYNRDSTLTHATMKTIELVCVICSWVCTWRTQPTVLLQLSWMCSMQYFYVFVQTHGFV